MRCKNKAVLAGIFDPLHGGVRLLDQDNERKRDKLHIAVNKPQGDFRRSFPVLPASRRQTHSGSGALPLGRPAFFANAEIFQKQVLRAVANAPTPTRWVVVTAEPITDVDITAASMLTELDNTLHQAGMDLYFAELKGPVKDTLKRYGLFARLGTDNFFPTIEQAVEQYLAAHKIDGSNIS